MTQSMETPEIFENPQGFRTLFKNKNFLNLWLGQIFSQLADRVIFVVFVAFIAFNFGTQTSLQSWLYVFFTIPAIMLTSVAGVFIDRWDKKKTMIVTNLMRAFIIAMMPIFSDTLFHIYALAFLLSSATQFFVPAEASMIPCLVKQEQLMSANSLFTMTMMGSLVFGFVLGDPLINIFGLSSVNFSISAFFIVAAIFLNFIKHEDACETKEKHKTFGEFYGDLKEGISYVKNTPVVLNSIAKLTVLFSIVVMMSILAISISQEFLYPDNKALGAQKFVYIVTHCGLGMLIGGFLVGKVFRDLNKMKLIYTGFTIIGASLFALSCVKFLSNQECIHFNSWKLMGVYFEQFSLTSRMLYSYLMAAIFGLGCAFVAIPTQTLLHKNIKENMRGKVFGVQFTMLSTASTLPVVIAAFGADAIGVNYMLLLVSLPVLYFSAKKLNDILVD